MMEDAKGQVGGLESGDAVRRAMALESGGWRCAGCGGRTNQEVLEEQEELARKMEEEGVGRGTKEEEKVPEELKLGYREDIERKEGKSADDAGSGGSSAVDCPPGTLSSKDEVSLPPDTVSTQKQPSSQHAEPIPQDQPLPPAPQPQAATIPASVPVPVTSTQAQPPITQPQTGQQQQLPPAPTANSWIDLAIVGIAVMLGAMVVRKLLLLNE